MQRKYAVCAVGLFCACTILAGVVHAQNARAPAYVINEIQVTDPARYREYATQAPETLLPFGGHFIVRGGRAETLSGNALEGRIAIIEFPSIANARAWHASPAYQRILPIRDASSTSRIYFVEGLPPPVR